MLLLWLCTAFAREPVPLVGTGAVLVRAGAPLDLAAPGVAGQLGLRRGSLLVRSTFGTRLGAERFPEEGRVQTTVSVGLGPVRSLPLGERARLELYTVSSLELQRRKRLTRSDQVLTAFVQTGGAALLAGGAGVALEIEGVIGPRDGGFRLLVGPTFRL